MEHFRDYLPILVAMIAISSAAIFSFWLPKWSDYFNDRSRIKLKDALDIRKNLKENGRAVSAELEGIINFYENDFIRKELAFTRTCECCQDKKFNKYMNRIFGLLATITVVSVLFYLGLLLLLHLFGL